MFSKKLTTFIDCKIIVFEANKKDFESSFVLHKVEIFDIMLGNWIENP
jgi:hypothetical protein